jgi:hypothetical protein
LVVANASTENADERGTPMGKIVINTNVSLDGVVLDEVLQAVGGVPVGGVVALVPHTVRRSDATLAA